MVSLKKFDDDIDQAVSELFEKKTLFVNRANLLNEQHDSLNETLELIIIRLSPYFHHESCKKVFEWLIYKYQVYRFS